MNGRIFIVYTFIFISFILQIGQLKANIVCWKREKIINKQDSIYTNEILKSYYDQSIKFSILEDENRQEEHELLLRAGYFPIKSYLYESNHITDFLVITGKLLFLADKNNYYQNCFTKLISIIYPNWAYTGSMNQKIYKVANEIDFINFDNKFKFEIEKSWCKVSKKDRANVFSYAAQIYYYVSHNPGGHYSYILNSDLYSIEKKCKDKILVLKINKDKICKYHYIDHKTFNIIIKCTKS